MSRPTPALDGPAADARAALADADSAAFDRLAHAVLAHSDAPLGPLLRAQLPGTSGVRWLRQEGLPATARVSRLTRDHWLSLFACWSAAHRAPGASGPGGPKVAGRPSTSGHGRGMAVPRWGQ